MQRADSCLRGRTVSHRNSARPSPFVRPAAEAVKGLVAMETGSGSLLEHLQRRVGEEHQLGSRERESSAATLAARQLPPPTHRCRRLLPSRRQLPLMPSAPICWRGWRPALGPDLQRCMRCRPRTASAPRKCGSCKRWVQRCTERIAGLAAGCRQLPPASAHAPPKCHHTQALSDAHIFLFEERERLLAVTADNDSEWV